MVRQARHFAKSLKKMGRCIDINGVDGDGVGFVCEGEVHFDVGSIEYFGEGDGFVSVLVGCCFVGFAVVGGFYF